MKFGQLEIFKHGVGSIKIEKLSCDLRGLYYLIRKTAF